VFTFAAFTNIDKRITVTAILKTRKITLLIFIVLERKTFATEELEG